MADEIVQEVSKVGGDPTPPEPAVQAPTPEPPAQAEGLSSDDQAKLLDRLDALEKRAKERPLSVKDQIAEALGIKGAAVDQRDEAKETLNVVEAKLRELEQRETSVAVQAAAAAAKFADPKLVAEILRTEADKEGFDPAKAVADLAERAPYMLASTGAGRTPDVSSGNGSRPDGGGDTAADRLAAEIDADIAKSPYAKLH